MKRGALLYEGKAKKIYRTSDPDLYLVEYKDEATAFNGLKKGRLEGKGALNNTSPPYFCVAGEERNRNAFCPPAQ